jgi:hypothetical protein
MVEGSLVETAHARPTQVRLGAQRILCALFLIVTACGGGASPAAASPSGSSGPTAAASPSPSPSSSPRLGAAGSASPHPRGWVVDQPSGGGRITGRHCGGELSLWVADGTYDRQGQQGQQHWEMDISLVSLVTAGEFSGEFSYTDHAVMTTAGVTVTLDGEAKGDVQINVNSSGRALMRFAETSHKYHATVPGGGRGSDQNAPLATFDLAWEVDPTCP